MELDRPLFTVIIPHLNQSSELEACLASLDAQRLDRACFEIIVVDNGSASPPYDVIARHSGVRLLSELQPGPGPARNTGIRNAKSDVLAFLDADCRAHPDWLRTILDAFQTLPEGTIIGGDVRIWRHDGNEFTAIEAYESVFGFRNRLYIEQQGYSVTANLAGRRADLQTIKPFVGIQFAEDIEWGQRAREVGFRFHYVPDMIVFHPARRSLHELCMKWDRQIQHYLNMAQGKPAWKFRWIIRALAVLGSPAIDFTKVIASDRIRGVSTRCKAIVILVAIRTHRARKMLSLLRESKTVVWNRETGV
jgi:glycosyltransferase involved in cell wall biosynthesis